MLWLCRKLRERARCLQAKTDITKLTTPVEESDDYRTSRGGRGVMDTFDIQDNPPEVLLDIDQWIPNNVWWSTNCADTQVICREEVSKRIFKHAEFNKISDVTYRWGSPPTGGVYEASWCLQTLIFGSLQRAYWWGFEPRGSHKSRTLPSNSAPSSPRWTCVRLTLEKNQGNILTLLELQNILGGGQSTLFQKRLCVFRF